MAANTQAGEDCYTGVQVNPRLGRSKEEVDQTVAAAANVVLAAVGHRRAPPF